MNIAFIDGQNLHLGTKLSGWKVDHKKFRDYLSKKYNIEYAYYYLGYVIEEHQDFYEKLQKSGFIIRFREHMSSMKTKKKGNVDTEIVFDIMKALYEDEFDKAILVSGDGDYKKVVDYLIKKERFEKILFPNRKYASSLYRPLHNKYGFVLSRLKDKIGMQ